MQTGCLPSQRVLRSRQFRHALPTLLRRTAAVGEEPGVGAFGMGITITPGITIGEVTRDVAASPNKNQL